MTERQEYSVPKAEQLSYTLKSILETFSGTTGTSDYRLGDYLDSDTWVDTDF